MRSVHASECLSHTKFTFKFSSLVWSIFFLTSQQVDNAYKSIYKLHGWFLTLSIMQPKQPPEEFQAKRCLRNFTKFTGKQLFRSFFVNKDSIKKETLAQVLPYKCCTISNNTFFTEHLWTTASLKRQMDRVLLGMIP